jgi:large subunit ribosomal protein L5
MAEVKDTKKGKGGKPTGRPPRKDSAHTPQALDDGSEESKFHPRLRDTYRDKAVPALMKEFGYKNMMQVPKLERIVLNVGMSEAIQNVKLLESAAGELGMITGQRAVITKAKKAIAGFKLREGMPIGAKVTLRNRRMYEFFDRLVSLALPRIRDFRGVSPKAFDGRGNYTLGLKEQLIFPEIQYDEVASIHGMDITIVTTARTNDEGKALLKSLGMPFRA